jgi:hypothetical protein
MEIFLSLETPGRSPELAALIAQNDPLDHFAPLGRD